MTAKAVVTQPERVFLKRSRSIYNGMKARAKKLHQQLNFTLADFRVWLLAKFDSGGVRGIARCEYSGSMILAEDFFVDHRKPTSRGGSFALENMVLCTGKENLRKGNMSDREYEFFKTHVTGFYPLEVQAAIWRKLEIGDVQRFSHFRRERKRKTGV